MGCIVSKEVYNRGTGFLPLQMPEISLPQSRVLHTPSEEWEASGFSDPLSLCGLAPNIPGLGVTGRLQRVSEEFDHFSFSGGEEATAKERMTQVMSGGFGKASPEMRPDLCVW